MSKKVLQFANKLNAGRWIQFQIKPMRPSVDPTKPPAYLIDVQGQRGDGVVFTVTVAIDKGKIDLVPVKVALEAEVGLLNNGIRQLMTFTGCDCTANAACEVHKQPTNGLVS